MRKWLSLVSTPMCIKRKPQLPQASVNSHTANSWSLVPLRIHTYISCAMKRKSTKCLLWNPFFNQYSVIHFILVVIRKANGWVTLSQFCMLFSCSFTAFFFFVFQWHGKKQSLWYLCSAKLQILFFLQDLILGLVSFISSFALVS